MLLPVCGWFAVGAVSAAVCAYSIHWTDTVTAFPRDKVVSITGSLIVFLGITAAILIAAFTTVLAQVRTKQDSGFPVFLESLGQLKIIAALMEAVLPRVANSATQPAIAQWAELRDQVISSLDDITPVWGGYEEDTQLENELHQYVVASTGPLLLIAILVGQQTFANLQIRQQQSVRGILISLRALDEAAVDRRLAASLVKVFASVSVLLICCLLVRIFAGVGYGQGGIDSTWVNLFIYMLLSGLAVAHLSALLHVVLHWWRRLRLSEKHWES